MKKKDILNIKFWKASIVVKLFWVEKLLKKQNQPNKRLQKLNDMSLTRTSYKVCTDYEEKRKLRVTNKYNSIIQLNTPSFTPTFISKQPTEKTKHQTLSVLVSPKSQSRVSLA